MEHETLLSVIIPVYNRASIVERTLRSVASQTLRPLDVILVDNNSTDGSRKLLERWASDNSVDGMRVTVLSETTPGACAARNCGLRAATTPVVMFFDSDDTMAPGLTRAVADRFLSDQSVDIVGWDIEQQLSSGKFHTGRFETHNPLFNHLIHGSLSTQRFACRRELALKAGGWNESVRGWNDYEFGVRLLLHNPTIAKLDIDKAVTAYFSETSITGRSFAADPSKWEHSLDLCESRLRAAGHADAAKWIDVRRLILAAAYHREGAVDDSRRLSRAVIDRYRGVDRMVFRLVYAKARIYGRGTHLFARFFIKSNF